MPSYASETDSKKAKFSWLGDPASRFRGKGKATVTRGDMRELQDFNERLISPLDRPSDRGGQPSPIQVGGQPARLSGQPSAVEGARIAARYRTPVPTTPPNPNLTRDTTIGPSPQGALNPNGNNAATAIPSDGLGTGTQFSPTESAALGANKNTDQAAGALQGAASPAAGGNGYEPPNPRLQPVQDARNPFFDSLRDPQGAPGETRPSGSPDSGGNLVNPVTGAPATDFGPSLDEWKAGGGTEATFHQMQVAKGLRPPVDAHSVESPRNSTAGAEIAAKRGWGMDADKDARGISKQMTNEFDQNNAKSQAEWNKKFTDAHAKLMDSLNNN